jgi:Na+/H+ antiporter NhaD/arsenite permease-like protein
MTPLAVAIFVASYVLIALRRVPALPIGRAAGALLGAVATVAFGVLSPERALASIDGATLVLLVAMMLLSGYLERSGLFERLEGAAQRACPTPRRLLLGVALAPGLLSAFLLNDAVCLFLAGPLVRLCARHRLPPAPYLLALATSANLGSAATLVGNPQNMIVGSLSGYGFVPFLRAVGPAALAGLLVNAALLLLAYGRGLPARFADAAESPRSDGPRPVLALLVTLGIAVGLLCDFDLGFTVLAGVMVLVIADRREPTEALAKVDLSLLVFFSGLFVVVAGLESTGLVRSAWESLAGRLGTGSPSGLVLLSGLLTVGSNLVSNVPMVLLTGPHLAALGDPERAWALVAFVTTVAGNLTLVGSVANLIVAERAREHYDLGFVEYLRFGVVSTTIVLAVGVPLVCWTTAG